MRRAFFGMLCLVAGDLQAEALHARAGEEVLIERSVLHLERLVLEDGAVLRLAPSISHLQLNAEQAWIGNKVSILARGADGRAGREGQDVSGAAACQAGVAGTDGGSGSRGGDGADLELSLGLRSFGSLLIDTRGGAGGAGGRGGAGGAGGDSDTCIGAPGGQGGRGGNGGGGGKGGDVSLRYWSLDSAGHIPFSNYGPGIWLETAGGAGAVAGTAGAGGNGGAGQAFKRSTGIKVFRDSGIAGAAGAPGQPGAAGADGRYLIQPQLTPGG